MNAKEAIDKAHTKKRLGELIGNKDRTLAEANELVDLLVGYVVQHGGAIIDMRSKMIDHGVAIETLGNMFAEPPIETQGLIGFDEPKIIGIPKHDRTN